MRLLSISSHRVHNKLGLCQLREVSKDILISLVIRKKQTNLKKMSIVEVANSLHLMYHLRCLAQVLLIATVLFVALADLTSAMSKKFIKGFLLGAYIAKHHEPVVVVAKKQG